MKRQFWLGALLAATLISGTALVACGGDDDDDGGDTTPAATQAAGATEPAAEPTDASSDATEPSGGGDGSDDGIDNLTVTATDFAFEANLSSVGPGSVVLVAFTNNGSAQHTLTFYTDDAHTEAIPSGDSGRVSAGESLNFSFEAPESGEVYYRCEVHPEQMQGELEVE